MLLSKIEGRCRGCVPKAKHESDSPLGLARPADPMERGSAAVEFIFLATILLVPVVYLILTLGQLQGGAYAAVNISDRIAKIIATTPDAGSAQQQAEQTLALAVADYGFPLQQASMQVSCSKADCSVAGNTVSVLISIRVPLPLLPMLPGVNTTAATMQAEAVQVVSEYR